MADAPSFAISLARAEEEAVLLPELIHLLQDAVDSGASVGFLAPLSLDAAQYYWQEVFRDVACGTNVLLVARETTQVVGSVQLALATKPNATHRAEVQKLFVLQTQRRRGIARALMQALEEVAREQQRTLLVLDTRLGDTAEQLYRKEGYLEAGVIPAFARSSTGTLDSTIFFYKLLS